MGILGSLVKTAIEVNQKISFQNDNPINEQKDQLKELLNKAKDIAFGKYYGFEKILDSKDIIKEFQKTVPLHNYKQMSFWWDQQQQFPDISWPGLPNYFALTSGTTGNSSKRIPITNELSDSMRKVGVSLTSSLPNFDIPEEVFESSVLMLSSSADLKKGKHGHLEGEISGINVHNLPNWYELFYKPGKEIASIDNWDQRLEAIVKEAPNWDIGAIAGIPSWVLLMLQEIVKQHKIKHIQDIWPNFRIYASGGVAFETYREDFEKISNKPLIIIDTYLASEGFFAYTEQSNTLDMRLALSHGYFYEFIPFDERGVDEYGQILDNPEIHTLDQVVENQVYVLIISSCVGAWRYMIGDTIQFTSVEPHQIKITGRTKFFLNVVGSQLSEEKMDEAIIATAKTLGGTINEYMVAAMKNSDGEYIHQWVLVSRDELDAHQASKKLDELLQEKNKNYKVARSKALKGIDVKIISKEKYNDYLSETKKKGGQVKTPKVMKEEKMKGLLDFLGLKPA
tara:strand:- start:860 stop:2389 length:1530 start_codon:yes stop_codon:yes gene_type:complete